MRRLDPLFVLLALAIAPAGVVMGWIGTGAGVILAEGRTPDLNLLFSARIPPPLAGLALLLLLPALPRGRSGACG